MIIGIGIDICSIDRIEGIYKRHGDRFINRIFTPGEVAYCFKKKNPFPHLAGIFAAKEATKKAFRDRLNEIAIDEIEVVHLASGRPMLKLAGTSEERAGVIGIKKIHLSISHDQPLAVAIVIFE